MRHLLFCAALTACGGIIDNGDAGNNGGGVDSGTVNDGGGSKKDGAPTADVVLPPACTDIQSETVVDSSGGCQSSASWSCGATKYSVQCNCPSTQCTCSEQDGNGTGSGTLLKEPSFCPKCDSSQLPSLCGFPTN